MDGNDTGYHVGRRNERAGSGRNTRHELVPSTNP